jgi:hypothetical protein
LRKKLIATIPIDFYEKHLANSNGYIEISYFNPFEELKFFHCYFTKDHKVISVINRVEPKGFLLSLPYYFWALKKCRIIKKSKGIRKLLILLESFRRFL